jgi:hypothetical protein
MLTPRVGELGRIERAPFMASFINSYANLGNIALACKQANVGRKAVYRWYREDIDGFKGLFDEAYQEACELVEAEIHRRGVKGWDEGVWYKGDEVGTVHKYSDILLIFLAKALMPDKYRDKFEGANILSTGPIANLNVVKNDVVQMIAGMPEDELKRLVDRGRKQIEAPSG